MPAVTAQPRLFLPTHADNAILAIGHVTLLEEDMITDDGKHYYLSKLPTLMKHYDKVEAQLAATLTSCFSARKIQNLLVGIRKAYEALIPDLPYIGGDTNPATRNLIDGALSLPILLFLEQEGISMRDMAKIIYYTFQSLCNSIPLERREQIGELYFSQGMREITREACLVSQSRKYPGDWVYTYVEGDGRDCDYGLDFSECGIVKLYRQIGAERFAPILCLTDYANFRSLRVGFRRTHKIATGDAICDFRFKKDFETPSGWPPDELEEAFPF